MLVLPLVHLELAAPSGVPAFSARGTGWNFDTLADLASLKTMGWWYNWGTSPTPDTGRYTLEAGMQFVGMQWGQWNIDDLDKLLWPEASVLLGFNEPNHPEQANLLTAQL
ncbi:hypothetical protein WJX72_005558 [[Myrmecia] bisecta]|uniref:Asl1-like glycosyl hydrolase catalytic domain-containing protein n=1 Tax=[Myrmecia] bisecta TaxID=41462 RepID=A0AAW1P817_9CHLO